MHLLFLLCLPLLAQTEADEIMVKVAANFAHGPELRRSYVYTERTSVRLLRADRKVARQERRAYLVTPIGEATEKKLTQISGHYRRGKDLLPYTEQSFHYKGLDIDADLIDSLTDDLINDKDSRDGISTDSFPFLPQDLPN